MPHFIKAALVLFICVLIASCECGHCPERNYVQVELKGYTVAEVDSVMVIRYKQGSNFAMPKDSLYPFSNYAYDSLNRSFYLNGDSMDYIISLPRAGVTYQLTNVQFGASTCKSCGRNYPIHALSSYTLNGVQSSTMPVVLSK